MLARNNRTLVTTDAHIYRVTVDKRAFVNSSYMDIVIIKGMLIIGTFSGSWTSVYRF